MRVLLLCAVALGIAGCATSPDGIDGYGAPGPYGDGGYPDSYTLYRDAPVFYDRSYAYYDGWYPWHHGIAGRPFGLRDRSERVIVERTVVVPPPAVTEKHIRVHRNRHEPKPAAVPDASPPKKAAAHPAPRHPPRTAMKPHRTEQDRRRAKPTHLETGKVERHSPARRAGISQGRPRAGASAIAPRHGPPPSKAVAARERKSSPKKAWHRSRDDDR